MVMITMQSCEDYWKDTPYEHCTQLHQRKLLPLAYDLWEYVYAGGVQECACSSNDTFKAKPKMHRGGPYKQNYASILWHAYADRLDPLLVSSQAVWSSTHPSTG